MLRRPPRSTRTDTLFPYTTLFRSLYFPEIERFAGNSRSDWFLAMIERFPTPGSIASIGREDFTEQVWPLIGRKVSKARVVNDIYETACASMALPIDEDYTAVKMLDRKSVV